MPEMALYVDEEEIWKCPKHPSRRRRCGICHVCLRERLATLCPECANVRPCGCCSTATTTSSSSSSSSSFSLFSRFSSSSAAGDGAGVGSVGRVSNLIESEPSFRRSRSVAAIPFLRSRSRFVGGDRDSEQSDGSEPHTAGGGGRSRRTMAFWSVFKSQKSKRGSPPPDEEAKKVEVKDDDIDDDVLMRKTMMMRSRSVAVPMSTRENGVGDSRPPGKGRSWYFPSPIKVFRQSKISKLVRVRSPLYRG
ncbi:uncharacterized protein LOC125418817 [Ziziphus jujuba]|uniref:Uncharacterized protein LOC125418817 n=1 Tax=Ziziphus jujuba TaxID=326968 RepID=A0ABM3I2R6_ZIZJJ|nr:uncharacterized protein LOC125418817 [Ziziphus jujuba]